MNVSSDVETIDDNPFVVLFRRRDIRRIVRRLSALGHRVRLDLTLGNMVYDQHVDMPPYKQEPHIRLQWDRFVTTSVALIVEKGREGALERVLSRARLLIR